MSIKQIRNEAEYRDVMRQIEELMNARAGTPDGALLDELARLVEAYESEVYPVEEVEPAEIVKFYAEQNALAQRFSHNGNRAHFRSTGNVYMKHST